MITPLGAMWEIRGNSNRALIFHFRLSKVTSFYFGNFGDGEMVRSGLLRDGERGFGASALALARRQGAFKFLFETGDKLGAAYRAARERFALQGANGRQFFGLR